MLTTFVGTESQKGFNKTAFALAAAARDKRYAWLPLPQDKRYAWPLLPQDFFVISDSLLRSNLSKRSKKH